MIGNPAPLPRPIRMACLGTHGGHAGGAAIAMERLVSGLRSCGADVDVVTRDGLSLTHLPMERRLRRHVRHGRVHAGATMFTLDWPAWDVSHHPSVASADLVNVHWSAGFLNAESIRRITAAGRPVIWTLHDMRPFTGGCHYAGGCDGFVRGCTECPQLAASMVELPWRVLARSRQRMRRVPIVFVAPSRWLAEELRRSQVHDPDSHAIEVIPNGIDTERFAPTTAQGHVRRRLGLPEQGMGILLGSVALDERRKGIDRAVAAIAVMRARLASERDGGSPPFVVSYGSNPPAIEGISVYHRGAIDEAAVIDAIHACDVHLMMTREDNLPNTVMEAMACGVPVVGTAVGGLPDMIHDGVDGWLVPSEDSASAGALLARVARDPDERSAAGHEARRRVLASWTLPEVARRYLTLAEQVRRDVPPSAHASGISLMPLSPAAVAVAGRHQRVRGILRRLRRVCPSLP